MKADDAAVDRLIELLERGESLEAIARDRTPPEQAEALRLMAVPRSFDQSILNLLSPETPMSVDEVVSSGDVEPAPGRRGQYSVVPDYRAQLLGRWIGDASGPGDVRDRAGELVTVSELLAEHYRGGPVTDRLYHLIVSDPSDAARLFVDEFKRADEAFDLARAEALVNMLASEDRQPFLTPELSNLLADRRGYLGARAFWANAYHDTVHYLERLTLEQHFTDLLEPDGPRVLQFHARGGMGKTMQLRWFIARHCLPMANRVPFAYLDFDEVSPIQATLDPWLVLLEIAGQLDRQLTQRPFRDLTEDPSFGLALPSISRRARQAGANEHGLLEKLRDEFAVSVQGRFHRVLSSLKRGPVVVILDTLEEVHINAEASLQGLAELLFGFVDQDTDLRLVFSGRQNLLERPELASMHDRLAARHDVIVEAFSDAEALRYLATVRGIGTEGAALDEGLAAAVVDKAEGVPLKLSLLADHIRQAELTDKVVTAAEIESYESAEIWYLMERVIDRIPDPQVRWLVRYGVIPRELTLDFVRQLVVPWVARGLEGNSDADDPANDPPGPEGVPSADRFPVDPSLAASGALDPDVLWDKLRRYVSSSSWVWEAAGDSQALQFHADVLRPMRSILRNNTVYRQIHDASIAYYEGLAGDEASPRSATSLREAIFHRFQRFGPAAGEYWLSRVSAAVDAGDHGIAGELAIDLLGSDYLDLDDPTGRKPVDWRDESILSEVTLSRAAFEAAAARVALGQPESASDYLRRAEESEVGLAALPPMRLALVRAAIASHRRSFDDARAELATAALLTRTQSERIDVARARVDLLAATADDDLVDALVEAIEFIETSAHGSGELNRLRHLLAAQWTSRGRVDLALAEYGRQIEPTNNPQDALEEYLAAAEANILIGAPLGLEPIHRSSNWPEVPPRVSFIEARNCLRRDDLVGAEAHLNLAGLELMRTEKAPKAATGGDDRGQSSELIGLLFQERVLTDRAHAAFERGSLEFEIVVDYTAASRCHSRKIALHLRVSGKLRMASQLLAESPTPPAAGTDEGLMARLLTVEHAGRLGHFEEADVVLDEVASMRPTIDPWGHAAVAIEALALGPRNDVPGFVDLHAASLAEALDQFRPTTASVTALDGLDRVPVLHQLSPSLRARLGDFAEALSSSDSSNHRASLAAVELLRVVGHKKRASELHARVGAELPPKLRAQTARLRQQAVHRLWPTAAGHEVPDEHILEYLELNDVGSLRAAVLTETAERWVASNRHGAQARLDEAEEVLDAQKMRETQWGARLFGARAHLASDEGLADVADSYAARAGDIYARLGDERRGADLVDSITQTDSAADRAEESQLGMEIHVSGRSEPGQVSSNLTSRSGRRRKIVAELSKVLTQPLRGDPVPYDLLSEMLDGWQQLARDVSGKVFGKWWGELDTTDDLIGLEVDPGPLDRLPWELLLLDQHGSLATVTGPGQLYRAAHPKTSLLHRVRATQINLSLLARGSLVPDGILGPRTRAEVFHYQQARGLEPTGSLDAETDFRLSADAGEIGQPSAILVRPTFFQEQSSQRGSSVGGVDHESLYWSRGIRANVVEDAMPEDLLDDLRSQPVPSLIHFSTGIGTGPYGLHLDFAGGDQRLRQSVESEQIPSVRDQPWTTSSLDRILRALDAEQHAPIIVLDVPSVPTPSEAVRQLILRNMFAAELFALGNAPVILGTGLAQGETRGRVAGAMHVPGTVRSVMTVASEMRRASGDMRPHNGMEDLFLALGAAGTALWTTTPHRAIPADPS